MAVVLVAITVLSGCGPINAGSAAGVDFKTFISSESGVADVGLLVNNTLPFSGSVDATVTLDDDVSDERLRELTDLIGQYVDEHKKLVQWSPVVLETGAFGLAVTAVRTDNDQLLGLYADLRAADTIVGAAIGEFRVSVTALGADQLVAAYDQADALLANYPFFDPAELFSADSTAAFEMSGSDLTRDDLYGETGSEPRIRPDAAISAFHDANVAFELASAGLSPIGFGLKLRKQADVAPTTAFIAARPDYASLGSVTITSSLVTLQDEGDYSATNRIVDELGDYPGIIEIRVSPNGLRFVVDTGTTAQAVDTILANNADVAALDFLSFETRVAVHSFYVSNTDYRDRQSAISTANALLADDFVTSVTSIADELEVLVDNAAGLAEFAPLAKRAIAYGITVDLETTDFRLRFTATSPLTVLPPNSEFDDTDPVLQDTFIAAWNAAPPAG
ncbi:hypothetical protein [Cryobacterium suzukii]|nr:hypothetical protein [Cryobacterium suzukii]